MILAALALNADAEWDSHRDCFSPVASVLMVVVVVAASCTEATPLDRYTRTGRH